MKVTFFSNFLNHHQIPFCEALYNMIKGDFTFVSTEKPYEEQVKLGYQTNFEAIPYLLESFKSQNALLKAKDLALSSDVVIIGSADEIFLKERIKYNKLTFRYSERIFKTNRHLLGYPKIFLKRFSRDTQLRQKNVYMLSASAFTPIDFSFFLSYPNKFFRWGYFPPLKEYDIQKLLISKYDMQNPIEIVWVGRMVPYKKPFDALYILKKLIEKGIKCHLTLVGNGKLKDALEKYTSANNLTEYVTFAGAVAADNVRGFLEKARICLVTSNKEEGWGAAINEAMNSGCVVFSYYRIGAAPYLIEDNINGILYSGKKDLLKKVIKNIGNVEKSMLIGKNAYETILYLWNAQTAAKRFVEISQQLLDHRKEVFLPTDGPMSIAPVITSMNVFRFSRKARSLTPKKFPHVVKKNGAIKN